MITPNPQARKFMKFSFIAMGGILLVVLFRKFGTKKKKYK